MICATHITTIIKSVNSLCKTLKGVTPLLDGEGYPIHFVGNSAVCFPVMHKGKKQLLKCYKTTNPHLKEIYGERFLPQELLIFTGGDTSQWVDVVLDNWQEGSTLTHKVGQLGGGGQEEGQLGGQLGAEPTKNKQHLKALSLGFNKLAYYLLQQEWAHGDLSPDNIIVDEEGQMHLIDFDAKYTPGLCGSQAVELGTAAFQHPLRDENAYDKSLDDYPIALIASMLHAMTLDSEIYNRYKGRDGLLLNSDDINTLSRPYTEMLELMLHSGSILHYRMLQMLTSAHHKLDGLLDYMKLLAGEGEVEGDIESKIDEKITSFQSGGRWGYKFDNEEVTIPAIYDKASAFNDGIALCCTDGFWQYINHRGEPLHNCGYVDLAKPPTNGVGRFFVDGVWHEIKLRG